MRICRIILQILIPFLREIANLAAYPRFFAITSPQATK